MVPDRWGVASTSASHAVTIAGSPSNSCASRYSRASPTVEGVHPVVHSGMRTTVPDGGGGHLRGTVRGSGTGHEARATGVRPRAGKAPTTMSTSRSVGRVSASVAGIPSSDS